MKVEFKRTTVEPDKVNRAADGEDELEHWKRVKIKVVAKDSNGESEFLLTLDLRPRLLQVVRKSGTSHGANEVARTLVNQMCRFILVPRGDLFQPTHVSTADRAEWVVQDAIQVSGLLHRLDEDQTLARMENPPQPPGLHDLLLQLMRDVKGNRSVMDMWNQFAVQGRRPVYGQHLSCASWDILGPRLAALLHDRDALVDFAAFFEYSRAYATAVTKAMETWDSHKQLSASNSTGTDNVWAFFNNHHRTAIQIADRLEARFGKT